MNTDFQNKFDKIVTGIIDANNRITEKDNYINTLLEENNKLKKLCEQFDSIITAINLLAPLPEKEN